MQSATDFCAKRILELEPSFQENMPNALGRLLGEFQLKQFGNGSIE